MSRPRTPSNQALMGYHLRTLRQRQGLTLQELARRLGISYQQIQKYEKGESAISGHRLYELSRLLAVPCEAFFNPDIPATTGFTPISPAIMARAVKIEKLDDPAQRNKILKIIDILAA